MKLHPLDFAILGELLKNAKRSDREVAERLHLSQPTVTRRRKRLETAGIIQEYTFIPDFPKLGYHILAVTLLKYSMHEATDQDGQVDVRRKVKDVLADCPFELVLGEDGMGIGYDGVTISLHHDYPAYVAFKNWMRRSLPLHASQMDSFLVDLDEKNHYRSLTFATLAKHLLTLNNE